MTLKTKFLLYAWLIDKLKHGRLTQKEILDKWSESADNNDPEKVPSESTFGRDIRAIKEIFQVNIKANGYNEYYIVNPQIFKANTTKNWMLNALIAEINIDAAKKMKDKILLEATTMNEKYSDTILQVISALENKKKIKFIHKKYGKYEPNEHTVAPWCLKFANNRWYILGKDEDLNAERCFGIDRILDLEITDFSYRIKKGFDAKEYFSDFAGVYCDKSIDLEFVVLRAYGRQKDDINDLPLHHSQTIKRETDEYVDFEYYIRPTIDFKNTLYALSPTCVVIRPKWLADEIEKRIEESLIEYKNRREKY